MLCTIGIVAQRSGFPSAGTLISTFCQLTSSTDAVGTVYYGYWEAVGIYANGTGGVYNSTIGNNAYGCFYPYGYYLSYNQYDSYLTWSTPYDSGQFIYGYSVSWEMSDGSGGYLNSGQSYVTATHGQVITSWVATDGATGYPTQYTYFFNSYDNSIGQNSFIVAGTILSYGCTSISKIDEDGISWENINSYQYVYADGSGGTYTEDNLNQSQCGYLPYGYVSSRQESVQSFSYYKYDMTESLFEYGTLIYRDIQDGNGSYTSESFVNYYYGYGYVFYSYYDEAGLRTVNFVFDGYNGYFEEYIPL